MLKKYTNGSWSEVKCKKYGNKADEFAEFPVTIKGDGNDLTDYGISGNMYQSGTPTPTTPIQPQECGERTGNLWDEEYPNISRTIRYIPLYVGNGSFTLSTTTPYDDGVANLFLLSGDVSTGASTPGNGVWLNHNVTAQSVDGYVTIAYRHYTNTTSPTECKTMLNLGSTALPYEPYGIKIPISSGGENLFDGEVHEGYYNDSGVLVVDTSHVNHSNLIKSNYNTLYTINGLWINIQANFSVCEWDKNKQFIRRSNRQVPIQRTITFSIGSDAVYFSIQIYTEYDYSNIMLNLGSEPLPYEPYNRTTTPIYLGEVPTTRRIKKLVLDGTEEWRSQYGGYTLSTDTKVSGRDTVLSTHYIPSLSTSIDKTIYLNSTNVIIIFDSDYPTLEDFKAYLAQQYTNGTPVCVWYVLAEPTTGIVNEPLRRIGDYVDTVSYEQAGVQIPTVKGNTVIDVLTELKPSEIEIEYTGWHDASVHEKSRNLLPSPVAATVESAGITIESTGDGIINVSGTRTSGSSPTINLKEAVTLNGTYYVHLRNTAAAPSSTIVFRNGTASSAQLSLTTTNRIAQITLSNATIDNIQIYVTSGTSINTQMAISIEQTESVTSYEPYWI